MTSSLRVLDPNSAHLHTEHTENSKANCMIQVCGGRNSMSLYEVEKHDDSIRDTPPAEADVQITTSPANNVTTSPTNTIVNSIVSGNAPSKPNPPPPAPASPPQVVTLSGWTYRGCWTDSVLDRTLIGKKWKGSLQVRNCAVFCSGYRYFGVGYGTE